MKPNIGSTDRIIRIAAGVIAAALGLIFHSWWGLIGILLIFTGLIKWCPAYLPFGISTIGHKEKEAQKI